MPVWGFQQQGCKRLLLGKVGYLSEAHPVSKLLGLVRFPAHKNSHMLSVDGSWALPSFLPVCNASLQGRQQDQRLSVLQRETAPVSPCLKSAREKQQGRGSIINSRSFLLPSSFFGFDFFFFFFKLVHFTDIVCQANTWTTWSAQLAEQHNMAQEQMTRDEKVGRWTPPEKKPAWSTVISPEATQGTSGRAQFLHAST